MRIELIGVTTIDWNKYISFCMENGASAPTRNLDSCKYKFNEQLAFVLTLQELINPNFEPIKTIRQGTTHLDTLSFIFITDSVNFPWFGCIRKFDLQNHICLLSGTLREWKDTIVTNLSFLEGVHKIRRQFFATLLYTFEQNGYHLVWDSYSKELLEDGSLVLKEK